MSYRLKDVVGFFGTAATFWKFWIDEKSEIRYPFRADSSEHASLTHMLLVALRVDWAERLMFPPSQRVVADHALPHEAHFPPSNDATRCLADDSVANGSPADDMRADVNFLAEHTDHSQYVLCAFRYWKSGVAEVVLALQVVGRVNGAAVGFVVQ